MSDNNNETKKYTATFTLSQNGLDDENIESRLSFDPYPEGDEEVLAYDMMSQLAGIFLYNAGVIDEKGELIDNEEFLSKVDVDVSDYVKKLFN